MCEGLGGRKESVFIRDKSRMATVQGRERTVNGKSAVARSHRALRAMVASWPYTESGQHKPLSKTVTLAALGRVDWRRQVVEPVSEEAFEVIPVQDAGEQVVALEISREKSWCLRESKLMGIAGRMDIRVREEGRAKDDPQLSSQSGISGRWCHLLKRERGENREANLWESEGTKNLAWKMSFVLSLRHPVEMSGRSAASLWAYINMNSYLEAPSKMTSTYILWLNNPNSGNVSYRYTSHVWGDVSTGLFVVALIIIANSERLEASQLTINKELIKLCSKQWNTVQL